MEDPLFQPFRFANGVISPNRLWLAPMTNTQSHADGTLSDDELNWLRVRAAGGFGVIESCATHVSLDGQAWEGQWGIFQDAHVDDWRRAGKAIRAEGALLFAQLFHGGERAMHRDGANARWSSNRHSDDVRAGTRDDIERVIESFAVAAERAATAGIDGIELHGAHGYLLCQFLQAGRNTRTDGWGTDLEGRARLLRTVVREVRKRVPAGFVVGVRLSPEGKWLDLDESVQTAQWLCEDGADFVHLSLWDVAENTKKRKRSAPRF